MAFFKEKLPLVGANLLLQFINQFLHPFIILTVLILPESQFFDASLAFPKIFGSITQSTLFTIQFSYKMKKKNNLSRARSEYGASQPKCCYQNDLHFDPDSQRYQTHGKVTYPCLDGLDSIVVRSSHWRIA